MMLTFASAVLLLSGCEKENGGNGNSDANSYENIDYWVYTFQIGVSGRLDGVFKMCATNDKFFHAENFYNTNNGYNYSCDICCVGEVAGLSSITVIPGDWFESVAIVPGYGYVGRSTESSGYKFYRRFFVTDIVKDSNGDWLAVKIRYASLDY